jgi:hypothetical protein
MLKIDSIGSCMLNVKEAMQKLKSVAPGDSPTSRMSKEHSHISP